MDLDKLKNEVKKLSKKYTTQDLKALRILLEKQMIVKEGKKYDDHFVCPVSGKVLKKKSGKKIFTERKKDKTGIYERYYYLSMKAYNKIIKNK